MTKVGFARRAGLFASALGLLLLGSASASAATIFGATGGSTLANLYAIDSNTGAATTIGPIGFAVTGLAFDPTSGILYGVTSNASPVSPHSLITVNPLTGAGTLIGDQQLGNFASADIAFDATGALFGWSEGTDELVSINKATGQATKLGDDGISTYGSGLVDIGGTLFLAGRGNTGALRTVNKTTGATTIIATLNGGPGFPGDPIAALTADSNGTMYGALNTDFGDDVGFLVTINPATGLITEVGPVVQGLDAIAFATAQPLDYGDAPLPYPTILALNGARHTPGGPFLGSVSPDLELDGQPNNGANGDDTTGADDEDGVTVLLNAAGGQAIAQVTVGGANGFLDGWIDFNQDGDWNDAGEQIFTSQFVPVGTSNLPFTSPVTGGLSGPVFSRFRISAAGGLAPTGAAGNGEVEDYILQPITPPPPPPGNDPDDNGTGGAPQLLYQGGALPLATLAGLFSLVLLRRRRK